MRYSFRMHGDSGLLISFGSKVRLLRKGLGLTQEQAAGRAGIHRTYLADIERGARNLSLLNVAKIARAFGVTMSGLFEGVDTPTDQLIGQ